MRVPKLFLVTYAALLLVNPAAYAEPNIPDEGDGWVSLFNGTDLSGWITPEGAHHWQVIDGVIDYEAKGGNLVTEQSFGNYELKIDWRIKRTEGPLYNALQYNEDGTIRCGADGKPEKVKIANADSGVYLRGVPISQINIWCWPCGSGQLWAFHKSRDAAVSKAAIPRVNADNPVGEWNRFHVILQGEELKVWLNETLVIDGRFPGMPADGPIALQHHGGIKAKTGTWTGADSLVQFRNIKIRRL